MICKKLQIREQILISYQNKLHHSTPLTLMCFINCFYCLGQKIIIQFTENQKQIQGRGDKLICEAIQYLKLEQDERLKVQQLYLPSIANKYVIFNTKIYKNILFQTSQNSILKNQQQIFIELIQFMTYKIGSIEKFVIRRYTMVRQVIGLTSLKHIIIERQNTSNSQELHFICQLAKLKKIKKVIKQLQSFIKVFLINYRRLPQSK